MSHLVQAIWLLTVMVSASVVVGSVVIARALRELKPVAPKDPPPPGA